MIFGVAKATPIVVVFPLLSRYLNPESATGRWFVLFVAWLGGSAAFAFVGQYLFREPPHYLRRTRR
jgi:predicted permease